MTKERPILFSGEMVRAILEGRKTQTRRVIKPQPPDVWAKPPLWVDSEGYFHSGEGSHLGTRSDMRCPYQVGMRLWVRETWAAIWPDVDPMPDRECDIEYRADSGAAYPGDLPADEARGNDDAPKWRPSIFMPRWASRITLEITGVRVERVQDISEADVIAEGCETGSEYWYSEYRKLWDSINGKKYPWASNPWVWVLEFRRAQPTEAQEAQ